MFKFFKSKLFLYFLSAIFLAASGQIFYVVIKNPNPITISIKDYLTNKSNAQWVTLTKVRLDLNKSIYSTGKYLRSIKQVYIPIISSEANSPKSNLYIKTDNKDLKAIMRREKSGTDTKRTKADIQKIAKEWLNKKSVKGLIQIGLDSDSKVESQIIKLSGMKDIRILELNASPVPWPAGVVGIFLAIGAFLRARKKKPA